MKKILGIIDLAQIEARLLTWQAGQADLLEGFANGEDVYSVFATTIFGVPVRKARRTDPEKRASILTIRRGFGKDGILGCGYGMGATKFHDRCLSNPGLKPYFDSGAYDFVFIQGLIKTYRTKYSMIPKYWNQVEKAFKWVIKYPHQKPVKAGIGLRFWNDGGTAVLELPSGRCLYYPKAHITRSGKIKWEHGFLWGGSITENIIQAIARDIFAEGILRLEAANYSVVMHAHDEVICMIPKKGAEKALEKMMKLFCICPDWAAGMPLAAEGELSEFYKK